MFFFRLEGKENSNYAAIKQVSKFRNEFHELPLRIKNMNE